MTASACCFSKLQFGSATCVWFRCLLASVLPSLAERFMLSWDEEEEVRGEGEWRAVGVARSSLWAGSCSISSLPSES